MPTITVTDEEIFNKVRCFVYCNRCIHVEYIAKKKKKKKKHWAVSTILSIREETAVSSRILNIVETAQCFSFFFFFCWRDDHI